MVTTTASNNDSRYRTPLGTSYDGVVRINMAGYYGTGSLLSDGQAVLTAAHLFAGESGAANVTFETNAGVQTRTVAKVLVHPNYDPINNNNDLAIVWLSATAPQLANRYEIFRDSNEVGRVFTMVGYGKSGVGSTGTTGYTSTTYSRLKAENQFDADAGTLKSYLGPVMSWSPLAGTQLVADFDNGSTANDALGRLIHTSDLGLGLNEGLIAVGDSGGPGFLAGKVAAVASYTSSLSVTGVDPDIDTKSNSSFGEIAAWQRVSAYQQWIDQSMRTNYPNAPTKPEEVKKQVAEGSSGTSYAYFLLQFTGVRNESNQVIVVDYSTRDGTAFAGKDYLAVSGRINLYPGEIQAVIPVEVVGDLIPEPQEYFYLDAYNPVGGNFDYGVVKLTAVRTILDDDGWLI